jgi:release factor glutamine methyltransferase
MPVSTITEALRSAARVLHPHSDSPRLDAELLLAPLLGLSRAGMIAHGEEPLAGESERLFAGLIEQRAQGAPVAYLTGTREFWSLALQVTPAVLVPRPETELLVELALQAPDPHYSVLDLGTGSGAIALAIASERPQWRVTAVDVAAPALEIARRNAGALHLTRIDWRLGSWFEPVAGERFHLIVANPPYSAADDPALKFLRAEPASALIAGPSGLEALSAIAAQAAAHLHPRGRLILEHGSDQAPAVARLLERQGFAGIRLHLDFSGRPRATQGTVHSPHQEMT